MVNEILSPCWNNKAVTLKQGWVSAGRNLFHCLFREPDIIQTSYTCHKATRVPLLSALQESAHIGSFDLPLLFLSIIIVNKCHTEP